MYQIRDQKEFTILDGETRIAYHIKLSLWGIKMSKTNEKFSKQKRVDGLSKVKLMAPSVDGGPDREVTVVYQRKANYGTPSFLKFK